MKQDFEICSFSDKEERLYYEIQVTGKIVRGWGLDKNPELLEFIEIAKTKSVKKLIIFNLSNVTFWDTQGIQLVVDAVVNINQSSPKRAGIVGGPLLKDVAEVKFPKEFSDGLVLWNEDVDSLIKDLSR